MGEEQRALPRKRWELSESASRSFCVGVLVDYDHSFHCPFSCSPEPTPVFSFGDNPPRAEERVHMGVESKILVLW